jgi:hypothetical protein
LDWLGSVRPKQEFSMGCDERTKNLPFLVRPSGGSQSRRLDTVNGKGIAQILIFAKRTVGIQLIQPNG